MSSAGHVAVQARGPRAGSRCGPDGSTPGARRRPEISPRSGRMMSRIMRIVVVLPAPFGPRKPSSSPGGRRTTGRRRRRSYRTASRCRRQRRRRVVPPPSKPSLPTPGGRRVSTAYSAGDAYRLAAAVGDRDRLRTSAWATSWSAGRTSATTRLKRPTCRCMTADTGAATGRPTRPAARSTTASRPVGSRRQLDLRARPRRARRLRGPT